MRRGGIASQGLFNTQPPTGESVFAIMRRSAAGCHAAYGIEGAVAIAGEDTVHNREVWLLTIV